MFQKSLVILTSIFVLVSCGGGNPDAPINPVSTTPVEEEKVIVALGDSLTAWFGLPEDDSYPSKLSVKLEEEWYNYKVINGWVSGETSKQLLDRAELYLDQDPDVAIIVIGGNDGLRSLPIDQMKDNIIAIIDLYQENGVEVVIAWMDIPINLGFSYRNDFKGAYKEISNERNIHFMKFFLEDVAGIGYLNQLDKIHPTAEGYDIVVENLYQFLLWDDILKK